MAIRAGAKKVSFDASVKEVQILDEYSELMDMNRTEVLRELVRSLEPKVKKLKSN